MWQTCPFSFNIKNLYCARLRFFRNNITFIDEDYFLIGIHEYIFHILLSRNKKVLFINFIWIRLVHFMHLVFFFFIELILSLRWDFSRIRYCLQIRNLVLLWEHFSWASEFFDRRDIFDNFNHVTPLFVNFLQHISYQAGQCLTKILDSFYSCLHFFDMRNQLWIFSRPRENF